MEQDIQLSGLGIQPEHCVVTIEDGGLFMEPLSNARSYVNGLPVTERIPLHHGDRIMWGNHHFFRVNCPKSAGSTLCQNSHCAVSICVAGNELNSVVLNLSHMETHKGIAKM
jgi:predicted component of type VI protein secretion system